MACGRVAFPVLVAAVGVGDAVDAVVVAVDDGEGMIVRTVSVVLPQAPRTLLDNRGGFPRIAGWI